MMKPQDKAALTRAINKIDLLNPKKFNSPFLLEQYLKAQRQAKAVKKRITGQQMIINF